MRRESGGVHEERFRLTKAITFIHDGDLDGDRMIDLVTLLEKIDGSCQARIAAAGDEDLVWPSYARLRGLGCI